jgi:mRNA interferase MazF
VTPGELYWVELPTANGHEQSGRRPALILQDEGYAGSLPIVIVVPLTGAVLTTRFPGTHRVEPTEQNGLHRPSVILAFQIRAIDRTKIRDRIGLVSHEVLAGVHAKLDQL